MTERQGGEPFLSIATALGGIVVAGQGVIEIAVGLLVRGQENLTSMGVLKVIIGISCIINGGQRLRS